MAPASQKSRIALFFAIGLGVSLAMGLLKALAAWLADSYVYSVPWVGGFLRSIELSELSNLIAFAILGASIGAATLLLPRRWDHRATLSVLAIVSPFVFCGSYLMQQHLWIDRVASEANLSYDEARDLTNTYLEREVETRGFFGFFPFSTQLAELPVRRQTLESSQSVNPTKALTQELAGYDDPRANFVAYWFERVGWLVRFMYIAIAGLTGLIYYFKGYVWAEGRRRINTPGPISADRADRFDRSNRSERSSVPAPKASPGKASASKPSASKPSSSKTRFNKANPRKTSFSQARSRLFSGLRSKLPASGVTPSRSKSQSLNKQRPKKQGLKPQSSRPQSSRSQNSKPQNSKPQNSRSQSSNKSPRPQEPRPKNAGANPSSQPPSSAKSSGFYAAGSAPSGPPASPQSSGPTPGSQKPQDSRPNNRSDQFPPKQSPPEQPPLDRKSS